MMEYFSIYATQFHPLTPSLPIATVPSTEASSSYSDHAYAYPLLYILPIEKSKSKSRPSKTYDPGRPLLIFVMLIVLHLCQLPDPEPLHLKRARKNALVRALSRLSESSLASYDDLFPVSFQFHPNPRSFSPSSSMSAFAPVNEVPSVH